MYVESWQVMDTQEVQGPRFGYEGGVGGKGKRDAALEQVMGSQEVQGQPAGHERMGRGKGEQA